MALSEGPVDRRKNGTKHHLMTDGSGRVPMSFTVTGANRHDVTQLLPLVDGVPHRRHALRSTTAASTSSCSSASASRGAGARWAGALIDPPKFPARRLKSDRFTVAS